MINIFLLELFLRNDGIGICLILLVLIGERCCSFVKDVEKMVEVGKVVICYICRDGNEYFKKLGLIEDDEKGYLEDV